MKKKSIKFEKHPQNGRALEKGSVFCMIVKCVLYFYTSFEGRNFAVKIFWMYKHLRMQKTETGFVVWIFARGETKQILRYDF